VLTQFGLKLPGAAAVTVIIEDRLNSLSNLFGGWPVCFQIDTSPGISDPVTDFPFIFGGSPGDFSYCANQLARWCFALK
jgi:hypothetical protein